MARASNNVSYRTKYRLPVGLSNARDTWICVWWRSIILGYFASSSSPAKMAKASKLSYRSPRHANWLWNIMHCLVLPRSIVVGKHSLVCKAACRTLDDCLSKGKNHPSRTLQNQVSRKVMSGMVGIDAFENFGSTFSASCPSMFRTQSRTWNETDSQSHIIYPIYTSGRGTFRPN